jgi:two-component system, sensor histidine kinase RegB
MALTMTDAQTPLQTLPHGLVRVWTLIWLRWIAVIGQAAAIVFVQFGLGWPVPMIPCLGLILASAALNVHLTVRYRRAQMLDATGAGLLLGYDIVQLGGLLFLTGGLQNPFAFLFLVPVTISATSLPLRWTVSLAALAFLMSTALAFVYQPLPWEAASALELPPIYIAGLWTALSCATFFCAMYARRIAVEARQMSMALSATEAALARAQRLSALDGLAAAAAHDLGTPLATIALVSKELKREMPANTPHAGDLDLLISQTARCREILSRLSNRDTGPDEIYEKVTLTAMIEDLAQPLRGSDAAVDIDARASDSGIETPEPVLRRNPAIVYGLGNLLENAIDFADKQVTVQARWNPASVTLTVTDDGPGFDRDVLRRLGDPFVTTRPGYDLGGGETEPGQHPGMGLGLFIAKTLLERSGASVDISNRPVPKRGAQIRVTWPRTAIDVAAIT